jgi:excisionase family DNA binding protein
MPEGFTEVAASASSRPDLSFFEDVVGGPDRLLEAAEVAAMFSVPERWVREATRAGRLPCVRLGRYVRYDRGDVLAWVEAQKTGGAAMTFRKHRPRAE